MDKILVEKVVKALTLLEQLRQNELNFILKGGTALMLLLPEPKRLSIDIDIIITEKHKNIESVFSTIIENSDFTRFELDERKIKSKISKAHYKFYYLPATHSRAKEEYVLLDILYELNPYSSYINEININSSFLKVSDNPTKVRVPTLEAILGDKLTAFAPNTTGVRYGWNKEIEIIKQLYDIGNLFDLFKDVSIVKEVFETIAKKELKYRSLKLSTKDVLNDIYKTGLFISTRGVNGTGNLSEIQTGIQNIVNYIFSESFHIDKAITHASKAVYLAALIKNNTKKVLRFNDISYVERLLIEQPFSTKLNKLKKSNPEAFFYWYHAINILK